MSAWLVVPGRCGTWRRFGAVLVALVLLEGCATVPLHSGPRWKGSPVALLEEAQGSAGGLFGQEADAFQVVQEACGLEEEARHPAGAALYEDQARQLRDKLARIPVTQNHGGAADGVLAGVLRALRSAVVAGPDTRGGAAGHARADAVRRHGGNGGTHRRGGGCGIPADAVASAAAAAPSSPTTRPVDASCHRASQAPWLRSSPPTGENSQSRVLNPTSAVTQGQHAPLLPRPLPGPVGSYRNRF